LLKKFHFNIVKIVQKNFEEYRDNQKTLKITANQISEEQKQMAQAYTHHYSFSLKAKLIASSLAGLTSTLLLVGSGIACL